MARPLKEKTDAGSPEVFMREAIALAEKGMRGGSGGPFGCVVVRDGEIVGRGWNPSDVNQPRTPKMVAIREACQALDHFELKDCELYTSCEPCPMCLAAIYWARIPRIYYANTRADAAAIGFDDNFLYEEIARRIEERRVVMTRSSPKRRRAASPSGCARKTRSRTEQSQLEPAGGIWIEPEPPTTGPPVLSFRGP